MSRLRARLDAIAPSAKPSPSPCHGGVACHVHRFDAEPDFYRLSPTALRRMGWQGGRFCPEKTLFLDTETTGLSGGAGTVAFLVGVGYLRNDAFVVEQYLMQDYSAEPEMLARLSDRMSQFDACVTFNGKSFDMPLLKARYTMCRMTEQYREMDQLDLLHAARRVWKLRLGRCRLSDLEERILGRAREGDLPGSEAPRRYFEYLRTGNEALLDDVVLHNRLDVASMQSILVKLADVYAQPEQQSSQLDLFSLGKALERQGELQHARELYRLSAIPASAGTISALGERSLAGQANWRQYLLLRRCQDWNAAMDVLQQMVKRRQLNEIPYVELAKIAEHHVRDVPGALDYVEKALNLCGESGREALLARKERLQKKMNHQGGYSMGFTDSIKANAAANKAYRLHAMGNQLLNTGKSADAKKKHDEALEAYAQSYALGCRKPQYMIGYGILLMRKGEFQRARDIMLEVNANPKLTKDEKYQLRINYSVCQWKLGHLDTAIETIRRAEKSGNTSLIYTTLGIFLVDKAIQTGDFSEAIAYNAEAMEYDDEDASTLDNMGQMHLAMSNKDLEDSKPESAAENRAKALDYFEKAHARKETQVTTLYALALLLHEKGQNDEARQYICDAEENLLSAGCPVSKEQILKLKAEIG